MLRRSPCEYYLKYLVVHPAKYDNDHIVEICQQHCLDYLGAWYLNLLRARHKPPEPFRPNDVTDVPSRDFITSEMIRLAFFPNDTMNEAQKILERPRLRELVEVMILSGAPHGAIVYALRARHGYQCSSSAIDLYRHYFWDIDLLDSSDMRALLMLRYEKVAESRDPEIKWQYTALKKAYHNDPRVMAAKLPISPLSALMSQIQMGVMPKDLNVITILEGVRTMSSIRALESAFTGGSQGAGAGQGFMLMADLANKLLESVIKPEDALRADLQNIAMKTTATKVPILSQLTSGNHTTELAPAPQSTDDDEEEVEHDESQTSGPQ